MSLYIYAVWSDRAIVAADTRQCVILDGIPYRKDDVAFKLHVVDDTVATIGGQKWLGQYIMQRWAAGNDHSVDELHKIVLEAVEHIDDIAEVLDPSGQVAERVKGDEFLLEILALKYDREARHNVLWQISSYNGFALERHDITNSGRTMAYGGIRIEIAKNCIDSHKTETVGDYLRTLHTAYGEAANEEVGGFLSVVMQDGTGVAFNPTWAKIPDTGKVRDCPADRLGGTAHIGRYLHLENPQVDENNNPTGVMQFKVDSTGAWLNNSTFVLQKDGGGKILLDPKYGIVAGTGDLFNVEGTTVKPLFIDENGDIVLDKNGMPVQSNFFLDLKDGSAYFRGTVYAQAGEFDGIVKARDFLLPSGESMRSVLNDQGKINSDWLDLYGINVKNRAGNTVMTIDENGVRFGTGFSPIRYQFSASASGPWHDVQQSGDEYRRESFDGGVSWSAGIKFIARDGRPGSDASVPGYIKQTKITSTTIESPMITGGTITGAQVKGGAFYDLYGKTRLVLNPTEQTTGGYADLCLYNGDNVAFSIHDEVGGISLSSYGNRFLATSAHGGVDTAIPLGTWDFSGAKVEGVTAVFA